MTTYNDVKVPLWVKITLLPWSLLLWAWTGSLLWAWFLVPLGFHAVSLAHAYGLLITGRWFTSQIRVFKDHEQHDLLVTITTFVWPLIALGLGYVAHLLMGAGF